MRSLYLTIMIFCQILLAAFVFYSAVTSASPVGGGIVGKTIKQQPFHVHHLVAPPVEGAKSPQQPVEQLEKKSPPILAAPVVVVPPVSMIEKPVLQQQQQQQQHQPQSVPDVQQVSAPVLHKQQTVEAPLKQRATQSIVVPVVQPVPQTVEAGPVKVVAAAPVEKIQIVETVKFAPAEQAKPIVKVPVVEDEKALVEKREEQSQEERKKFMQSPVVDQVSIVKHDVKAPSVSVVEQNGEKLASVQKLESQAPIAHKQAEKPVLPLESPNQKEVQVPVIKEQQQNKLSVQPSSLKTVGQQDSPPQGGGYGRDPYNPSPVTVIVVPSSQGTYPNRPNEPYRPNRPDYPYGDRPYGDRPYGDRPYGDRPYGDRPYKSPATPVKGGLGPLHLLAATLCSYQPERAVADETLNLLYSQRAALRKSLFDFMSLKFTNLEKLSSRLNPGFSSLEVVPQKTINETPASGTAQVAPSHGWPVVGKCTAHDLKLMAEAAWCETTPASSVGIAPSSPAPPATSAAQVVNNEPNSVSSTEALDKQDPKILSNQHIRARSLEQPLGGPVAAVGPEQQQQQQSNDAVISKILHVGDSIKESPVAESSLASLNLTQQQLASIQQQAVSTRECRRSALRLTKALFNHLAEDQKDASESWPLLYSQMAEDECARKRMIDVVTALSNFRGESTSIRRDNVEYAFAMDDLRAKVLENEVNVPLTFDKQFIEVEQFLQQSVKLMLANIDPVRAKLTSMRYRSLMPGPIAADDQCIELHQRLLAKNYPTDCNPGQYGQLPDVLRMAANSLALWSVEAELNRYSVKFHEYPLVSGSVSKAGAATSAAAPSTNPIGQAPVKQDVNECIANLVAS